MGQKKKPPAPRSKQSLSSSTAEVGVSACAFYEGGLSEIKLECEKALTSFRRGSYNKAIRLMKESCARHQHSALIHRVQGTVCVKVASFYEDVSTKQKYLRSAIESARKAVELSPNSIEFGHFYANLLYEAAKDGREYEEVVQECHRALSIENPIDPAKDSLQDESQHKILTPEARIANVQDELRALIQKSNLGSLSTWMKHLGNGEGEFRLFDMRRVAEDPIESSNLVQTRRPNEIKKATKTLEERRKEIEVMVAAGRLLQQKSESSSVDNKGPDPTLGSGQRTGERRKHGNARRNGSTVERRDRVRSYWESTSKEMKKELLRIKVCDLKSHFSASKDGNANDIITEALSFCEANKTWRFWVCCKCGEKFKDSEAHMQHIVGEHMGNVLSKMQMVLPQSLDSERIEMLLSSPWKPLDFPTAVKLLCSQQKIQNTEFNDFQAGDYMDDGDDCFQDAWNDTSPEKENIGDACNGYDENESEKGRLPNPFYLPDEWPISDDPERTKLLKNIRAAFKLLIKHNYLATSHYDKVIQFTLDELRNLPSVSQFLNRGLGQSPICIRFLGATQLKKILKFLQDLSHACGVSRYSEESNPSDEINNFVDLGLQITEEIILDVEESCLLLDEKLLGSECIQEKHMGSALNNGDIASSEDIANGNNVSSGADGFLSWISSGPSSGEQTACWMRTMEEKTSQGQKTMKILEKEVCDLQNLFERKCEHLSYEEALQTVEDLCLKEGRKRETSAEITHESYDSVLRKRREELNESAHEMVFISGSFELDAIKNVLRDADTLKHNQFGYEESYTCTSSQLRDLESGEADEWGMKDSFSEADSFIETAIQKQKEQLSAELNRIDALMMRSVTVVQQLEVKLGPTSSNDYQIVLLPLVRSCMRAHLEALAEKDATEKSDAASKAFLVELALDSKEARGRNDHSKHTQEKSKDKKKNKHSKKLKDSKASIGNDHRFNVDSVEPSLPSVASFGDPSEADVVPEAVEALKEQEEEYRHRIELELDEIKLEETLEYQRRIENEAKEKHVAEQQKKYSSEVTTSGTEAAHDICSNGVVDDLDLEDQDQSKSQENLVQRNGLHHDLEVTQVYTNGNFRSTNHRAISDVATVQDVKSQKVVANGLATQADVFQSDQRIGRRSRRQNKLVEPSESTGKERESESPRSNGDVGTKTLRQLQAEEDEEEKFQADLKKAVRQSLDTYQGGRNMTSCLRTPHEISDPTKESPSSTEFGTGLQNEVGEYNCFLNVIIQSLWNLGVFRAEFLRSSTLDHHHVGDPCVVCSLYEVLTALSAASREIRKEPVTPSTLRIALSNLYPDSSFFQEAQMNDASEVLAVIFDCLHRSFAQSSSVSDTDSSESNCTGSWDCANRTCIAHSLFGMNIFEQLNCYSCGLESRHMKYTSFFHNINASALRNMKVTCAETSFDELLNLVEMNHQLACDLETGGCGKPNHIRHFLTTPPHVFTTVLGWQNTCESVEDIAATLAALNTEIDISIMYCGLDPKSIYSLASVVCYYGQHYHCFAYSHEHNRWIMYDDKTVKVIGSWSDVLSMCERGHLQPQLLLYEKQRQTKKKKETKKIEQVEIWSLEDLPSTYYKRK